MLLPFCLLIYALCMREGTNWIKYLLLMFFGVLNCVHLQYASLVFEFPHGTSEAFLFFMLVHRLKIVHLPGMPLQQIQFIVILVSPEGKLLISDFILLLI